MSTLNSSALEDLWQVADGNPGPSPVDSVNSIDNHCRQCLDDQLLGATAQLFGANERSVPAILRHSFTSGIVPGSAQHAEVIKLRVALLDFILWLISEEFQARGLPKEQIAEYATEIVKVSSSVLAAPPLCPRLLPSLPTACTHVHVGGRCASWSSAGSLRKARSASGAA